MLKLVITRFLQCCKYAKKCSPTITHNFYTNKGRGKGGGGERGGEGKGNRADPLTSSHLLIMAEHMLPQEPA